LLEVALAVVVRRKQMATRPDVCPPLPTSCRLAVACTPSYPRLSTLRTDAALFADVNALRWRGPTEAFAACTERANAPALLERSRELQAVTD
jgi:hypothetical protein